MAKDASSIGISRLGASLLMLSVCECGGRVSYGNDSSGSQTSNSSKDTPSCEDPVFNETFVPNSTGERETLSVDEECLESDQPLTFERGVFCTSVMSGETAHFSLKLSLDGAEPIAGFAYHQTFSGGSYDVRLFLDHQGGTLECPTLNGDNVVRLDNLTAHCFKFDSSGHSSFESCPCEGPAPSAPSSFLALRLEATHDEDDAFARDLCLGQHVRFCTGDCVSWLRP